MSTEMEYFDIGLFQHPILECFKIPKKGTHTHTQIYILYNYQLKKCWLSKQKKKKNKKKLKKCYYYIK